MKANSGTSGEVAGKWQSILVARFMPHFVILAVIGALVLSSALGIGELGFKGLIAYGIPVIGAALIALKIRRSSQPGSRLADARLGLVPLPHLCLAFAILFFASLTLLFTGAERPLAYFILIPVMAGIICLEVLEADLSHQGPRMLILSQIVLLFLNVTYGVTLKFPLYYGGGDIPNHLLWISSIVNTHQVTPELAYYQYFPLSHVFQAIGFLVSGLDLKTSYFLFGGMSFAVAVPVTYLIVMQIGKEPRAALLAALLYSASQPIIEYGTYVVPRSVAFVFSLAILYLLLRQNEAKYIRLLAVLLIAPLIVWHQTTLAQFALFLILLAVMGIIFSGRSHIRLNYVALFTVAFLGYWLYATRSFFADIFILARGQEESMPAIALPSISFEVPFISSLAQNSDFSILLFLSMLGALLLLHQDREKADVRYTAAFFSLVAIPFFLPNFIALFNPALLLYRVPPLLMVLFALVMANSVLLPSSIRNRRKRLVFSGASVLLVIAFFFTSLVIFSTFVDINAKGLLVQQNRDYLTEFDIPPVQFLRDFKGPAPVGSDYAVVSYVRMFPTLNTDNSFAFEDGRVVAPNGYFLFRKQEYLERGVLDCTVRYYGGRFFFRRGYQPDIEDAWVGRSMIYDNSAVVVYLYR